MLLNMLWRCLAWPHIQGLWKRNAMQSEQLVHYANTGQVSTLTLDDGKVNVMSSAMLAALGRALDRAEGDGAAVLLTGRAAVFSAGFDMGALGAGGDAAAAMLEAGARMAERLLSFPAPVVAAVNGHAIAMGAFLALAADVRLGAADAAFKVVANEVAIDLTLPRFATAVLRHRLAPAYFDRTAITSWPSEGGRALEAGWFDELVPAAQLLGRARELAQHLAALPRRAYRETKLRVREPVLRALREGIAADVADWRQRLGRQG
jgi:enoyl-CoA hydratase